MGEVALRKAFVSAIAFALAVTVLAATAALVVQLGAARTASDVASETLRLGWRFNDATEVVSRTLNDAMADAAYQQCGCGASTPSNFNSTIHSLGHAYLQNSTTLLSDNLFSVKISDLAINSLAISSCNFTAPAIVSAKLSVTSRRASRAENFTFLRTLNFSKRAAGVYFNITEAATLVANVTVTCG